MPKILLFAPCQKAIISQDDKSVSLISVISGLTIAPPDTTDPSPINPNTFAPIAWSAVSVWVKTPDDDTETVFEQRLDVFGPKGGEVLASAETPFKMTHRTHQIAMNGALFPIGVPGEYELVLRFRVSGTDEWREAARYPIEITHAVLPTNG